MQRRLLYAILIVAIIICILNITLDPVKHSRTLATLNIIAVTGFALTLAYKYMKFRKFDSNLQSIPEQYHDGIMLATADDDDLAVREHW